MILFGTVLAFLWHNPLYILAGVVAEAAVMVFVGKMIKRGQE